LFGILLISVPILIIVWIYVLVKSDRDSDYDDYLGYIFMTLPPLMFYTPNILQTLLIVLYWPINFYFVKTCVFILVLSLTRNVSYFTDEVPKDFLATSTTFTQYFIQKLLNIMRESTGGKQKDVEMKKKLIEMMKHDVEIKELIKTIIKEVGNKEIEGQEDEKDGSQKSEIA